MKILHITKKYPNALGGDSVVVVNLQKQQEAHGQQTAVLTSNCEEIQSEGHMDGKHLYKFGLKDTPAALDTITPRRLVSLAHLLVKSFKVIRKERPDVIHTHSIDMAFAASFAARWFKVPMVHTFHIVTFHDKKQSFLRRKSELWFKKGARPKLVTAPDETDITLLKKAGAANARLLPNGIDLSFWKPAVAALETDATPEAFTFISAGRLEDQKGFHNLIDAAALLKHQSAEPFKIQIVGSGSQHDELLMHIAAKGLSENIELLGRKTPEEVRALYDAAHAVVIPSRWESTPITLLEAWAMQLPVVSNPVGILQGDKHAKDALVTSSEEPWVLAAAMRELMENPKKAAQLSERGSKAVQQYSWPHIYGTANALYKEAIKPPQKGQLLAANQRTVVTGLSLLTIASLLLAPRLSGTINTLVTLPLAVLMPGLLLKLGVFRNVGDKTLPMTLSLGAALGLLIMSVESWLMSWLLPFAGVSDPLRAPHVLAAQTLTIAALGIWYWFAYGKEAAAKTWQVRLHTASVTRFLVPLTLPLLAAAGAFRLNNGFGNQLTIIAFGLMGLLALIFLWKPKAFNPIWLLFNIALGLLLSTSLRSWYVSGFDISQEFQVFNMTLQHFHWNINAIPGNAYNSCLSLTTLPTMMQQLVGVTPEFIFKYFYQIAFALTSVVVYVLARRFGNERGAFASGLFYSAQAQFVEAMPAIVRQEISFLFFALLIYLLIANQGLSRARAALMGLLGLGMVLSHYSTTYVAIFIFTVTAVLLWTLRVKFVSRRLPQFHPILPAVTVSALAIFLTALSFGWYSVVNSSSSNLTSTISRSWHSLVTFQGLDYTQNGQRTRLIFGGQRETAPAENTLKYRTAEGIPQKITPANVESLPAKSKTATKVADLLRDVLAVIVKVLLPASPFILLIIRKTRRQVADLTFLGVGAVVTFILFLFLPALTQSYNIERVLQQALIILSITGLWALWVILPKRRMLNTLLTCSFVLLYLVLTPGTGVVNQMIGGTAPRLNMNNIGEEYQKYYTHESEVMSAQWLGQHCQGQDIWADKYATLRLTAYSNVPYDHIHDNILKPHKGCLMLDESNVKDNLYYAAYDGGYARYSVPSNAFAGMNELYTNGSSAVYTY